MKKNAKRYIDKGIYSHGQLSGYLSVKQFMVVDQDGKHCLLLRFANEADFEINAVEFMLTQINTHGETVGTIKIKYSDLNIGAGEMYSPDKGIVVKADCADFTVQILSIISGKYRYVFKRGLVTAHYDRRGYENGICAVHVHDGEGRSETQKKYYSRGILYRLVAVVSLILVFVSLGLTIFVNEMKDSEEANRQYVYEQYIGNYRK